MNFLNPVYTEKADCQDCYKCVRNCPVKAIKVENGSATVVHELCIFCGECVEVCPAGAKKVRNDLEKVKLLTRDNQQVIASLAPSYICEFPGVTPSAMIRALKELGFAGVSETALGAQEVSANISQLLSQPDTGKRIHISSACPSVVEYIYKYHPNLSDMVTPFLSPLLTHCQLLKNRLGNDTAVVFIGPCIAKKRESDEFPHLLTAAITYEDLRHWMDERKVVFQNNPDNNEEFLGGKAQEGMLYPVEGGMNAGIKANLSVNESSFMNFSGLHNIERALTGIERLVPDKPLFLELLACEGGCVNGPKSSDSNSTVFNRYHVLSGTEYPSENIPRIPSISINRSFQLKPVSKCIYHEDMIKSVLKEIGKNSVKDELNCAGCGYNTCRDFAVSLLENKSEKTMCVTYMRQLAQKKANALIKTMPSGIVIVDDKMKIVECNRNFAELMGEETLMLYEVKPGLEGALIQRILPFYKLFQNVLETADDIVGKELNYNNSVLLFSIFTIEKNRFVGGIFRDITEPWVRKEQIVNKARQVIKKNLSTVQKIAYLLGENAAETEVILNGIIESFSTNRIDDMEED